MPQRATISRGSRAAIAVTALVLGSVATAAPATAAEGPDHDATPFWTGTPVYNEQNIAVGGDGVFPNYRIPALTVAANGDLLASYDGRPTAADSPAPNTILQRRSTDGGTTWGPQTVIHAGTTGTNKTGYSDPSYIVDRETGTLFNFHVFSMDQGFHGSVAGVDPTDRNVMHAEVSTSTDHGVTWQHRIITADITPDLTWKSRFASAGQGIQLRYGPHAGRLIQQYTIKNASNAFQSVSIYSDDHGQTWKAGNPVGTGMDENKTVELSDGRVMLNSRDSAGSKFRKVAYSTDGGVTYGPVTLDRDLPDPTNNGSIVRAFPNAAQGSPEAKVLLFSNAASQTGRTNGTVRASCDDGENWPIAREFQAGAMAYSTLATLPDGNVGLLYEPGGNGIRYAELNLAWLRGVCAPITAPQLSASPGATVSSTMTIENQLGPLLTPASLTLTAPSGWTATTQKPADIAVGDSTQVPLEVTVPASATPGTYQIKARLTETGGKTSVGAVTVVVPVEAGQITVTGGTLTNPKGSAYAVGDRLSFTYRVTNLSNAVTTVAPTGNLRGFDPTVDVKNCRWINLPANDAYNCGNGYHIVTQADLDHGSFTPTSRWTSTSGSTVTVIDHTGPAVDLT